MKQEQSYLLNKIECWIILKNNRIIRKIVPYEKRDFRYLDKTYFLGNKYYIRSLKIFGLIPITRLCLFYYANSPDPISPTEFKDGNVDGVHPEQITERLKQGGYYAKMLQETPFDIMMQKIQFYCIIGCLGVGAFVAMRIFGVM